jgi:hypothetical protein
LLLLLPGLKTASIPIPTRPAVAPRFFNLPNKQLVLRLLIAGMTLLTAIIGAFEALFSMLGLVVDWLSKVPADPALRRRGRSAVARRHFDGCLL